ncbi:hypothetical protein [Bartonella sp. AU55XJBT]|uniref:hypothetical protein n=1 Tax=Bartonella sp. AU55XJBT TaxID=3019091 RepID=UPI00235F654B|nr:hypothetical protein [Bartonella sp. AU55XJBT]
MGKVKVSSVVSRGEGGFVFSFRSFLGAVGGGDVVFLGGESIGGTSMEKRGKGWARCVRGKGWCAVD